MRELPLSKGLVALVDEADYAWASQWKWFAKGPEGRVYAARCERGVDRLKRRTIRLHRELMQPPAELDVDHINGNGLDNRRENLRVCTTAENCRNRVGLGGYKGVRLFRKSGKWGARIVVDYRHIHLGCFATPEEAARAYDDAALKLHGPFARLNFP